MKGKGKSMKKRLLTILMAVSLLTADILPSLTVQAAGLNEETVMTQEVSDLEPTSEEETSSVEETEEETTTVEEMTSTEEISTEEETSEVSGNEMDIPQKTLEGEIKSTTVTECVDLYYSTEDASGPGWDWDCETKTLTLTDLDMNIAVNDGAGFDLPDYSTVVSSGTSNVIKGNVNYAIYGAYLTFEGSAPLTLEGIYCGMNSDYALTIENADLVLKGGDAAFCVYGATASDVYLKGCKITTTPCILANPTDMSGSCIPMSAEGTKENALKEVTIKPSEDPYLTWTAQPESDYSVKSKDAGMTLTLTAEAELKQGTGAISYQWYRCDDTLRTNAEAILGATAASYTISGSIEEGIYYYFCRATAEVAAAADTFVTAVYASASGKWYPHTLNLSTSDITSLGDYGISYTYDAGTKTGTLTLDNCTIGSSNCYNGIYVDSSLADANLIVNLTGENRLLASCYGFYASSATGKLTFTGDGSLDALSGYQTFYVPNMKVAVKEQAQLTVRNDASYNTGTTSCGIYAKGLQLLDEAKLTLQTDSELKYVLNISLKEYSATDFNIDEPAGGKMVLYGLHYVLKDAEDNVVTDAVLCASTAPALDFEEYPFFTSTAVDSELTLNAKATLRNAETEPTITYTWYNGNREQLEENTTGACTVNTAEAGFKDLYCVASCTYNEENYSCTGDMVTVAVLPAGRTLRTTILEASTFTTDQSNEAEGWSWDNTAKTLTLNNFMSTKGIITPAGCTVVVPDGTASYITTIDKNFEAIYTRGSLTVEGTGTLKLQTFGYSAIATSTSSLLTIQEVTLDATVKNKTGGTSSSVFSGFSPVNLVKTSGTWKREGSTTTLASKVNLQATELEKGSLSGTTISGVYNETTGFSEAVLKATEEVVFYLSKDLNYTYGTSVGSSLTLEVEAYSEAPITYTWYNAADSTTPIGNEKTLTLNPSVRGAESYYCVAESGGNKLTSKTARVVTGAAGKTVRLGSLNIYDTTSTTDQLATEGWSWDKETKTLTLSDYTASDCIGVMTDATIVLADGTENMVFSVVNYTLGMYGDAKKVTITGAGKLIGNQYLSTDNADLIIAGGARVEASYAKLKKLELQDEGTTLHLSRPDSSYAIRLSEEPQNGDFKITAPSGAAIRLINGYYYACISESSGTYVSDLTLQADTSIRLSFTVYPKSILNVNLRDNLELTAEAKLVNSSQMPEITYTWYKKTESGDEKAAENTTGMLSVDTNTLGTADYYCVASCETEGGDPYSKTGNTVTVAVCPEERTLRTSDLDVNGFTTDQSSETEGWSWNQETKTLTLDNFISIGRIYMPAESTIRLIKDSENLIFPRTANQAIYGRGNLTITGEGCLTLQLRSSNQYGVETNTNGTLTLKDTTLKILDEGCVYQEVYGRGGVYLENANLSCRRRGSYASAMVGTLKSIERTGLKTGTISGDVLYGTYNEETGYTEAAFSTDAPWFNFTELSEQVQTAQVGGKVTLKAKAECNESGTITYQWYATDDWSDPESNAVYVGSGKSLTLTCKERGGKYYYCVASCKESSKRSDVLCVVTAAKGKKPVLDEIKCKDTSIDKLSEEGWKWDSDTETLTLSDVEVFRPFTGNSSYDINAYWGNTIVLTEGTVNNLGNEPSIYISSLSAKEPVVTLKGKGTLNAGRMISYGGTTLKLQEGITVNADYLNLSGEDGNLTVDNATLNLNRQGSSTTYVANVTIRDGGVLTAKRLELNGNLVIEESEVGETGGSLNVSNYFKTGSVTIGKGGILSAQCRMSMYSGEKNTLTVNGTLDISRSENDIPFEIRNTETTTPVTLGAGVRIVTPEGAELKQALSPNYYYYHLGSNLVRGRLLIAEEDYAPTKVTKIGAISGKASYGQTLTAGALMPAGATVTYQWQYADTAAGPWTNISGAQERTWKVETRYADKSVRVVATGYGLYTGEAASAAVGPVVGDPATLTGIYLIGANGTTKSIGVTPFNGDTLSYSSSWTAGYSDETCTVTAVPANEKAAITIENVTNGFKAEGRSAEVPLVSGENELHITVSYNGKSNVYTVKQNRVTTGNAQLLLEYTAAFADGEMTASWKDAEGNDQTLSVDSVDKSNQVEIPLGTKVTLNTTAPAGMRAFRYQIYFNSIGDKYFNADWTKENSPYSFVFTEYTHIYARSNTFEYLAPTMEADWLVSEQNTLRIKTDVRLITDNIDPELREYFTPQMELTGADGTAVKLPSDVFKKENMVDTDGDGYYDYWIADIKELDSTKAYTVKVRNRYNPNSSDSPEELFYAIVNVEARKSVQLIPEKDYVVLKPGETTDVDFTFDGYEGSELEMDGSTDTEVVDFTDCILTQKTESDAASIQIKAGMKVGTTYLTVKAVDTVDPVTGKVSYAVARIRVDVSSLETADTVSLGITSGSLNVYDDSAITVPVYRMNCGYPITGAEFENSAVAEKFQIEVVNDRTIRVTPVVPTDSDTMDWAAWAKKMKGTYKSKVTIHYKGTENRTSVEELTIKADAKAPSVKAAAVKCNSFYVNGITDISYTIKGETVAYAKVDAVKNTAKTKACPDWLTLGEDGKSVVLQNSKLTNNKASGKLYLKVWPQGWRAPAQISVSVSAAYSAPKLKLSTGTISVANTKEKFSGCILSLQSADKKVSLESLNVTGIRVASAADLAALSAKDRKTYNASNYYQAYSYNQNSGSFTFDDNGINPVSGKVLLIATIGNNSKQTVQIPLTVKTVAAPTLKLDKSSITLNTTLGTGYDKDVQKVTLTPDILGYSISSSNTTITVTDDRGNGDYSSELAISQYNRELSVSCNAATTVDKTYKVTVAVEGIEKPVAFTVKTKADKPTIKLSKKSLTLNRAKGYDYSTCDRQVTVATPSIKDYPFELSSSDLTIVDAAGNDVSANFDRGINRMGNQNTITISPNINTDKGNYKLNITKTLPDGSTTVTASCTIKVVDTLPKVKLSASTITLNSDLKLYDKAVVELKGMDGYYSSGTNIQFYDAKGNNASGAFSWTYSGTNGLAFWVYGTVQPGATYKAIITKHLNYDLKTAPVTLTIKVAPQKDGNTPVTVKGSVKGTIDLTRPENSKSNVNLTFNGWHPMGDYPASGAPVLKWEVYAKTGKNGKDPVTTAQGAINDNGLVASGSSDGTADDKNWFKNVADVSGNPYLLELGINTASDAWAGGKINPAYKYTVKVQLIYGAGYATDENIISFKVAQGKTKFSQSTKTVTLYKNDPQGRQLLHIENIDKDKLNVAEIESVELVSESGKISSALEIYEVTSSAASGKTYAIGWKDKTVPATVKSNSVKLNVFLKGNDPAGGKPNATVTVTVNVK
ncbi:MAG: hypothetical protein ACI39N_01140 [Lachnospiraceae bacterium]